MGWAFKPRWRWKSPLDNYCEHHQHPLQKGYSKIRLPNTATGGTSKTARHTFIRNSFSSTRFKFHANNQKKTMLSLSTSLVMALGARLLAQIFPRLPLTKKKRGTKTQESVSILVNGPNIFPTSYIQRRAAPAATDGPTALLGPWRAIVAWLQAKFARSTVLISAYGRGLELGFFLAMHIWLHISWRIWHLWHVYIYIYYKLYYYIIYTYICMDIDGIDIYMYVCIYGLFFFDGTSCSRSFV